MTEANYEMQQEIGADEGLGQIEPIHVIIDRHQEDVEGQEALAEWGSWQTFNFAATTTPQASFQQILPQNRKRRRAQIIVFNGTGAAAGAFVRVGTIAQVMNNSGGQLQAGRFPIENAQGLWAVSDGTNAMIVVVCDERYL